ncbi:MAG: AEC family transporter [Nanoarchaeota archaeon]
MIYLEFFRLIVPIFLIIILGYFLKKFRFFSNNFKNDLNKFVFYITLPIMLFSKTSSLNISEILNIRLILGFTSTVVFVSILSYFACFKLSKKKKGAFIQGAFRSNLAYLGIPIIVSLLGEESLGFTAIIVATGVIVNTVLTLLLFKILDKNSDKKLGEIIKIFRNPLIIAIVLGLFFSYIGIKIPLFLSGGIELVSKVSLTLILVVIGMSLSFGKIKEYLWLDIYAGTIKLLVMPIISLIFMKSLFGIEGLALMTGVIMSGMPTAIASYTFTKELNGDAELATSIINFTTLAVIITIPILLKILGGI